MKFIFSILIALVLIGLLALASASSYMGASRFNDGYYYVKHQVLYGLPLGILGFLFFYLLPVTAYRKIALPALVISIGLALLVFTPLGFRAGGADRWIHLGTITFQPAEFLKIGFILYIAAWLAKSRERSVDFRRGLIPFFIVLGVVAAILLAQPATSTVVLLLATAFTMYFVSGAKISYIALAVLAGALALALIIYATPYRRERIFHYLNPTADIAGGGYQLNQALIAIGSGGIFGAGYGNGTAKISSLPEPIGDSIFAVIAEEFGFVGSLILMALFSALVIKTLRIAMRTRDKFSQLVLTGFASLIGLQVFIHIGAISGLLPLTGIPLPFVSYGGTSLAAFISMGGILTRFARK